MVIMAIMTIMTIMTSGFEKYEIWKPCMISLEYLDPLGPGSPTTSARTGSVYSSPPLLRKMTRVPTNKGRVGKFFGHSQLVASARFLPILHSFLSIFFLSIPAAMSSLLVSIPFAADFTSPRYHVTTSSLKQGDYLLEVRLDTERSNM